MGNMCQQDPNVNVSSLQGCKSLKKMILAYGEVRLVNEEKKMVTNEDIEWGKREKEALQKDVPPGQQDMKKMTVRKDLKKKCYLGEFLKRIEILQ